MLFFKLTLGLIYKRMSVNVHLEAQFGSPDGGSIQVKGQCCLSCNYLGKYSKKENGKDGITDKGAWKC